MTCTKSLSYMYMKKYKHKQLTGIYIAYMQQIQVKESMLSYY